MRVMYECMHSRKGVHERRRYATLPMPRHARPLRPHSSAAPRQRDAPAERNGRPTPTPRARQKRRRRAPKQWRPCAKTSARLSGAQRSRLTRTAPFHDELTAGARKRDGVVLKCCFRQKSKTTGRAGLVPSNEALR